MYSIVIQYSNQFASVMLDIIMAKNYKHIIGPFTKEK